MAVNLLAHIELRTGALPRFMAAMKTIVPVAEAAGWRLRAAYVQRTGRLNTVIDVWELDDHNHLDRGLAALAAAPQLGEALAILAETIEKETLSFAEPLRYG